MGLEVFQAPWLALFETPLVAIIQVSPSRLQAFSHPNAFLILQYLSSLYSSIPLPLSIFNPLCSASHQQSPSLRLLYTTLSKLRLKKAQKLEEKTWRPDARRIHPRMYLFFLSPPSYHALALPSRVVSLLHHHLLLPSYIPPPDSCLRGAIHIPERREGGERKGRWKKDIPSGPREDSQPRTL